MSLLMLLWLIRLVSFDYIRDTLARVDTVELEGKLRHTRAAVVIS